MLLDRGKDIKIGTSADSYAHSPPSAIHNARYNLSMFMLLSFLTCPLNNLHGQGRLLHRFLLPSATTWGLNLKKRTGLRSSPYVSVMKVARLRVLGHIVLNVRNLK